jgi:hypothetical protein
MQQLFQRCAWHLVQIGEGCVKGRKIIRPVGGVSLAWPIAARTQQPATPVIGFLHGASVEGHDLML